MNEIPVNVSGVQFVGTTRTRLDVVEGAVQPCLEAKTFGELTEALSKTSRHLNRLELFKDMRFIIDQAEGDDSTIIVRVEVKEKAYQLRAGTEVQRNEVCFGAGAILYNLFGRGEKLDINTASGTSTAAPLSINLQKPLNGDPDKVLNFSIFSTLQHYLDNNKFKNRLQGLSASYTFLNTAGANTEHNIKYSLDWRHIFGIADDASVTVRRNAGHSIKSSLSHTMSWCNRDCDVFPSSGVFAKLSSEVAGLGGSVSFLRNDLLLNSHIPLYKQITLNMGMRCGHVAPLLGQRLAIIDKYQMGGPLSVRGFVLNSIGPKDYNDSVGGNLSVEGSLGVSFPLSQSTANIVRGHIFTNAGILTNIDNPRSLIRTLKQESINVSTGCGIQVKLGEMAKLEMNVAYPLRVQPGAIFHRGFQVGLGVEFL